MGNAVAGKRLKKEKTPFAGAVERYLRHLRLSEAPRHRLLVSRLHLGRLAQFLAEGGKTEAWQVHPSDLEAHLGALAERYSPGYLRDILKSCEAFFAYLVEQRALAQNPCEAVRLPRQEKRLPRDVPTDAQVRLLIAAIPRRRYRDRAIVELLYGSGLRRGELVALRLADVDLERQLLRLTDTKDHSERVAPFGELSRYALLDYLEKERPAVLRSTSGRNQYFRRQDRRAACRLLFLSPGGIPMNPERINRLVQRYAQAAGLPGHITAHSLRHACATEMLKGGAGIRWVQKLLGHRRLTTTMIYTRLGVAELARRLEQTHPHGGGEEQ